MIKKSIVISITLLFLMVGVAVSSADENTNDSVDNSPDYEERFYFCWVISHGAGMVNFRTTDNLFTSIRYLSPFAFTQILSIFPPYSQTIYGSHTLSIHYFGNNRGNMNLPPIVYGDISINGGALLAEVKDGTFV